MFLLEVVGARNFFDVELFMAPDMVNMMWYLNFSRVKIFL